MLCAQKPHGRAMYGSGMEPFATHADARAFLLSQAWIQIKPRGGTIYHHALRDLAAEITETPAGWIIQRREPAPQLPIVGLIRPHDAPGDYRQHLIHGLTPDQIKARLGFAANVEDDPETVDLSWGFTVDGIRCGVWRYVGGMQPRSWSAFGPLDVLQFVFGKENVQ